MGETGSSAATDQAAGMEAGGLVLSASGHGLQSDAHEEADPDSIAGPIGPKCVWRPENGSKTKEQKQETAAKSAEMTTNSPEGEEQDRNKGFFSSL